MKSLLDRATSPYKSDAFRSIHQVSTDSFAVGGIDEDKMLETDEACLRQSVITKRMKRVMIVASVITIGIEIIKLAKISRRITRG